MAGQPTVEILFFEGCPNYEPARDLVQQVASATGVHTQVRLIEIRSEVEAERLHFLGSPSVRVNGRDVEPGADARRVRVRLPHLPDSRRVQRPACGGMGARRTHEVAAS